MSFRPFLGAAVVVACAGSALPAQSLDLMIDNTGLSIGDSRIVRGFRLNFRDRNLERVDGINATIWMPYDDARGGEVNGIALGVPLTGARRISGLGVGIFGVGAEEEFTGIGVGGFGVGAGGDASGILIGGFGVGAGGDVRGLTIGGFGAGSGGTVTGITIGGFGAGAGGSVSGLQIGGFGVGSGGDVRGISIGGFGAGAGGDITGFTVGGFGAGAGGDVTGITVGGFGAGAGGDVKGLTVAGLGAGAGGDMTGITLAGIGAGSGGTLRGFTLAGVGAGAPRVRGIVVSSVAGGHDIHAGVIAPFYFRLESDEDGDLGVFRGVSLSAFNHMKGEQRGLTIGLVNYTWELRGWQLGLINCAESNRRLKCLPLVNWDRSD